ERPLEKRERLPPGLVHVDMRMRLVAHHDIGEAANRRVEIGVQIEAHRQRSYAQRQRCHCREREGRRLSQLPQRETNILEKAVHGTPWKMKTDIRATECTC